MSDRDKLIIPYSNNHFADIAKGPNENHELWVGWIKNISNCWFLQEFPDNKEKIGMQNINDINAHFKSYYKYKVKKDYEIFKPFINHIVQRSKEKARNEVKKNESVYPKKSHLYEHIIEMLGEKHNINGNDGIRLIKLLRSQLRDKDGNKVKFPEIPEVKTKLFTESNEVFRKLVNDAIKKSDIPYNDYEEFYSLIPNIPSGGFLSNFTEKINKMCTMANFWGIGTEKIKKSSPPNKFNGIVNDLGHLSLGLRCSGLISADKILIEKALFVKKMLNLDVEIYTPNDFVKKILNDFACYYKEKNLIEKDKKQHDFDFYFNDLFLRKYTIDLPENVN